MKDYVRYFSNDFFNYNLQLPIVKHSKDAINECYLLIGRMPINSEIMENNIAEKIKKNFIKGIISSEMILQRFAKYNIELIVCNEPLKAWAYLAWRNFPHKPENVIAITGTNGKTSTCWFVNQLLLSFNQNVLLLSTIGVFENGVLIDQAINTTSDSLQIHQYLENFVLKYGEKSFAIIETSSIAIEQHRIDFVCPKIGIWTNFSQDHLDYHESMQEYFNCKARLTNLVEKLFMHVSVDNKSSGNIIYGDELLEVNQKNLDELKIKYKFNEKIFTISVDILGEFQAKNILSALVGLQDFFSIEELIKKTHLLTAPAGRMQRISNIVIDFAHTPDALQKAIESIKKLHPNRVIVVMGCGGDRDKSKRIQIGQIMNNMADVSIITNDNPRNEDPRTIASEIQKGCPHGKIILDRIQAIEYALKILQKDDILLIAGKGHETAQIIKDNVIKFNDYDVIKQRLEE